MRATDGKTVGTSVAPAPARSRRSGVVVLLGRVAEQALRGEPVLKDRRVLVTVHPAAARRFPWLRRRFARDLRNLRRLLGRTR
jgi:uracil-DNA glycosylase